MGNPDLVIILNGKAYVVKGSEYETRDNAVTFAISKIRETIDADIKEIEDAPVEQLVKSKEELVFDLSQSKEIKTIEVYEI